MGDTGLRELRVLRVLCLLGIVLIANVIFSVTFPFQNHRGYVLILSDTHYPPTRRNVDVLVERIKILKPRHVFILGDLTEMGKDEEFEAFERLRRALETNVASCSCVFGNHDVRWTTRVRKDVNIEGGLYRVFEVVQDDIVFIGLDTSLFFEHLGHLGPAQLRWLRERLETHGVSAGAKTNPKTFVLLTHHPISYTDDGWKIYELSGRYNIAALVSGHVHRFTFNGPTNGMYSVTVGAAKDRNLSVLSWDEQFIYIWRSGEDLNFSLLGKISKSFGERLRASNTHERASHQTNSSLQLLWTFSASNTCYAPPLPTPRGFALVDYSGQVYLLDENGRVTWNARVGPVVANLAISDQILYVGDLLGNLYSIDVLGRRILHQARISEPVFSISVGETTLGVGAGSKFFLLDLRTLEFVRVLNLGGAVQRPATFGRGMYVFSSWDGNLHTLTERGDSFWVPVGQAYYTAAGCSPTLVGENVLFTHFSGYVGSISLPLKTESWRLNVSGVGFSDVALVGGFGFVSTINGEIVKFNVATGELVWKVTVGSPIFGASPVPFGRFVLVGTTRGEYALVDQLTGTVVLKQRTFDSYLLRRALVSDGKVLSVSIDGTLRVHRLQPPY